jgi:hypothetical protein
VGFIEVVKVLIAKGALDFFVNFIIEKKFFAKRTRYFLAANKIIDKKKES